MHGAVQSVDRSFDWFCLRGCLRAAAGMNGSIDRSPHPTSSITAHNHHNPKTHREYDKGEAPLAAVHEPGAGGGEEDDAGVGGEVPQLPRGLRFLWAAQWGRWVLG